LDVTCRICGSQRVELFLDLGDQPHCNRLIPPALADRAEPIYPLRTGFCHDCTLVQIDHTVPKESMFSDYPYVSGTTRTLVQHFKDTAERLVATYGLGPGHRVVDIGSNDGSFLAQYQPLGLTVLGVEAAANVARLAQDRGVETLVRFFNEETAKEILADHGPARLVTAAGVFFHLEELHSVVRGIHALIGDDGVFVVQAIYLGGMVENLAFDQIYHEHLCYYTLRSLEALFARHGLAVFDVRLVPIHGGTIEVHVARAGRRQEQSSVAAMRAQEAARRLGLFETYQAFGRRVWALRDELLSVLRDFKAKGRTVYAFGAPAKGATLLNSFKIGPDLVAKAVEKNPMKVGMMIPGCRIPIVGEDVAPPDAYLMLAWNFLDEFLERERPYLDRGGAFIVPVPAVRVITGDTLS
jgi:2-polyprenyl-3-methyl-5-hydroxy-6-metoxy-1,4-benzoquinol methylase